MINVERMVVALFAEKDQIKGMQDLRLRMCRLSDGDELPNYVDVLTVSKKLYDPNNEIWMSAYMSVVPIRGTREVFEREIKIVMQPNDEASFKTMVDRTFQKGTVVEPWDGDLRYSIVI